MDDFSRFQLNNEERKKRAEEEIGGLEEIAGQDFPRMSVQQSSPVLPR